jgi:hypothetical protein
MSFAWLRPMVGVLIALVLTFFVAACARVNYRTDAGGAMNFQQITARYEDQLNQHPDWKSKTRIRFVHFVMPNPITHAPKADALIQLRVSPLTGEVIDAHVMQSDDAEWGKRALHALKSWRVTPFDIDGRTDVLATWWLPMAFER